MSEPSAGGFQSPTASNAKPGQDAPFMSTPETLTGIFFEPGRVFESFRERPKFLIAGLISIVVAEIFTILLFSRISMEAVIKSAIENSPQAANMSPEQMDKAVGFWTGPFGHAITYGGPVIAFAVIFAAGAGLYVLGVMLMGKKISYKQSLSVWVYSSFPPLLIGSILNILLLYIKSADDIDPTQVTKGGGLVRANLGILMDATAHPVFAALLGSFDLFVFYGLFLAALGLRKVARLTSGSAWSIVIGLWIIGVLFKVCKTALFGG